MAQDNAQGSFSVSVITPEKVFFSGEAKMVTAPGSDGEFGVLVGHAPFVSTLRPGIITVESADHEIRRIAVIDGVAEVTQEKCTILAETARDVATISSADAEAELRTAEESVQAALNEEQTRIAEKRLLMARTVAQAV